MPTDRYECTPDPHTAFPGGQRPPELYAYPDPCHPVRLLFVGSNPPKPFGGFWETTRSDNLRTNLHWILNSVGAVEAMKPDEAFLNEFRQKGFFFIHAVKCWTRSTFPGFGRSRERGDRSRVGLPLLRACAWLHLATDLRNLDPQCVCALGEVAFFALAEVWKTIPTTAKPTQGRLFSRDEYGLPWDLHYTSFPSRAPAGRRATESLRAVARRHLSKLLT